MFRRKTRRFIAVPDHHQRRMVLLRPPGILKRRPVLTVLAVLAVIVLLVVVMSVGVAAMEREEREWLEQEARNAADCPDPNPVWEGEARGDLETDLFEVSTDRFIVSYEVQVLVGDSMYPFLVSVEDEQGREVSRGRTSGPRPGGPLMEDPRLKPNEGRYVVEAHPGSYWVAVSPSKSDRRYAVLVEECGTI